MALGLWVALFLASAFAPMRWGMVAFLCLSTIDFEGGAGGFASFNVLKGIILPLFLLWRLRAYSGHRAIRLGVIAWALLVSYVGIAGFWSLFPISAVKLVGHMLGSLMTACVLMRATKGGYLTAKTAIATAAGSLLLGVLATYVNHGWGDEKGRFTSFIAAQGFASFLAGLYCVVLCGRGFNSYTRVLTCAALALGIVMDGSRIWFAGILLATFIALLVSEGRLWFKICAFSGGMALLALMIFGGDTVFGLLARDAATNRIASTITALYEGDTHATGLGTFNFRRQIDNIALDRIQNSTITELLAGRGTCNGAVITGSTFRSYSDYGDPNRMFHNEWLRVLYEWGFIGAIFWLLFVGSILKYAIEGFRLDPYGDATPLLIYLPAFLVALSGENMLAGSVNAVSMAFIYTIALASIPHRSIRIRTSLKYPAAYGYPSYAASA